MNLTYELFDAIDQAVCVLKLTTDGYQIIFSNIFYQQLTQGQEDCSLSQAILPLPYNYCQKSLTQSLRKSHKEGQSFYLSNGSFQNTDNSSWLLQFKPITNNNDGGFPHFVLSLQSENPRQYPTTTQSGNTENHLNYIDQLREIAWMQSHLVRAPLARIMALANLIEHEYCENENISNYLELMTAAANELDAVIHQIVAKSEKKPKAK